MVTHAAAIHGLIPAVHHQLRRPSSNCARTNAQRDVQRIFEAQRRCNLRMTAELLELLVQFASRNLRVLPFKGPVLAQLLYGDVSARKFSDLDLLVFAEDAPRAMALLRTLGYAPIRNLSASQERACVKLSGALSFVQQRYSTMVDLHWRVRGSYQDPSATPFCTAQLWARAQPLRIWGRELSGLSRDDLLLVLAEHGAKHRFLRLEWLCDVARLLLLEGTWDWPLLLARAKVGKCRRSLALALLLSSELFGSKVPPSVLADSVDSSMLEMKRGVLSALSLTTADEPQVLASAWFRLGLQDQRIDGLRFLLGAAFRPTLEDWMFLPVPLPASAALTALRPVRLMLKYAIRAQRGDTSASSKQPRSSSSPAK
jgi:hypothetical protein